MDIIEVSVSITVSQEYTEAISQYRPGVGDVGSVGINRSIRLQINLFSDRHMH